MVTSVEDRRRQNPLGKRSAYASTQELPSHRVQIRLIDLCNDTYLSTGGRDRECLCGALSAGASQPALTCKVSVEVGWGVEREWGVYRKKGWG